MITFADERKAAAIDDVFAALDRELVGLVPVKKQVEEIGSLLLVDRVRQRFGLLAPRPNLHMCFTGAPGTGKTTVGLLMADLLHQLGYLERGQLVHAMRDDMVGEYVGQTAPKTRRVLDRAMGGVLFIDEASALYQPDNSKDFGLEAIETLLQVMENERDKFIVILAGYKDRMDTFFESNPGLRSRVAHHIDFADYDVDELVAIGRLMLERASYYLSAGGGGVPRVPDDPDAAAAVRQRPQRPQRAGAGPAPARSPPRRRPAPRLEAGRSHAHRGRGHPRRPGLVGPATGAIWTTKLLIRSARAGPDRLAGGVELGQRPPAPGSDPVRRVHGLDAADLPPALAGPGQVQPQLGLADHLAAVVHVEVAPQHLAHQVHVAPARVSWASSRRAAAG